MQSAITENINTTVRQHEETTQDWPLHQPSQIVYRFYTLINDEFFDGRVPTPVILFKDENIRNLGHYVVGRNEIGVMENINLNLRHLDRPIQDVVVTLAHELSHSWQRNYGKAGSSRYHNEEFRQKTLAMGIPSDPWGHTLGLHDPFLAFLRKHGIEAEARFSLPSPTSMCPGGSKLKRWTCGCTNIRAAVVVQARCLKCGRNFVQV